MKRRVLFAGILGVVLMFGCTACGDKEKEAQVTDAEVTAEGETLEEAPIEYPGLRDLGEMLAEAEGVDYEALDDEPSNLLFMIAAPNDGDVHLEVLSRLMTILMDEDFREKLMSAKDTDEFLKIIDDMENEKYPDEPKTKSETVKGYKVLAVTACPTGIAHTYMAAEALEKASEKLGISIKVETNG